MTKIAVIIVNLSKTTLMWKIFSLKLLSLQIPNDVKVVMTANAVQCRAKCYKVST